MCDRHEEDAALLARGGERLGCYRDQAGHRVLRGFVRSSYTFIIMFIFQIVLNPCLCADGGGGRTARGRVCECAALRATASRAWSGGGSATADTTRPPRTPGHTGRRHSHQTFGKLFLCIYSTFTPQFKYFPLSSTKVHTYYQYLKSVCLTRRCTLQDC